MANKKSTAKRPGKPGPARKATKALARTAGAIAPSAQSDWKDAERISIEWRLGDAKFAHGAELQIKCLRDAAKKLRRGEGLHDDEAEFAALACEALAGKISLEQPKRRGHQPQWDHGKWAMSFVFMRARGASPTECYAQIADAVGVSEQAVEKVMRIHAPSAARLLHDGFGMSGIPNNLFKK